MLKLFVFFIVFILIQNFPYLVESRAESLNNNKNNNISDILYEEITHDATKEFNELFDHHQWVRKLENLENDQCKSDMKIYLRNLKNGTLWAAKMYDASGRYHGEFFFGNDYWLGSLTLCEELQNKETNIEIPPFLAKYYVAKIIIKINNQFTPQNRRINLGVCLPKSCSIEDVRKLLNGEITKTVFTTINDIRIVPGNYSLLQDIKFQIIGISGLITIFLIITSAILEVAFKKKFTTNIFCRDIEQSNSPSKEIIINYDGAAPKKKKNTFLQILFAFSAVANGKKILAMDQISKNNISCLHGLRVFSIAWIILVHTHLEIFGVAKNKGLRTITERNFLYQTIANATYSVDTFFFISGLLLTYGFFKNETAKTKNYTKNDSISGVISKSISKFLYAFAYRYVRLTPAYLFILGSSEVVIRYIHNTSVFTPALFDHINCDQFWWRNILYINNFWPQEEFCMLWSWYMANDTQFFVIATVLLIIAIRGSKQLKYISITIGILIVFSWILTFCISIKYQYATRIQEPFALFDQLYDKPWMRIGPYLIGMIMGYALFKVKGRINMSIPVIIIGWCFSLICLAVLVYGVGAEGLNIPESAFYVSLGHSAWALSLAWITIACSSGYGGPINLLLSSKLFLPLSRLTYGAYLVHTLIMCLTSFNLDGPLQIHKNLAIVLFCGNLMLSFMSSFLISLLFEAPAINIMKLLSSMR